MTNCSQVKIIIAGLLSATPASAEVDYNAIGKKAYAQWDCAAYAALTEDYQQAGLKLFETGYEKLFVFVEAWRAEKLNKNNTSEVPVGVTWNLISGPSADFSIGYMWAQFLEEADKKTWDEEIQGSHDELKTLQAVKAVSAFREKNCELILE
ncbi:hypothetical protein [Ruegeria arenilitoris]|uniref:hypothetical protein n=1 Tax=Ruegeria arenilitoris TaxID=1173585 RepID=UPI00147CA9DD|nr:hypothetical protein [Ruegeria arenilitoris]